MLTEQLFDFLAASPSCYHAVQAIAEQLERNGYTQLREQDAWALTPGGKYFVTRNGSSLLSFRIPQSAPAGFLMAAAHTDSPTFKIKHNPEKKAGPYVQLSTEKYGGIPPVGEILRFKFLEIKVVKATKQKVLKVRSRKVEEEIHEDDE